MDNFTPEPAGYQPIPQRSPKPRKGGKRGSGVFQPDRGITRWAREIAEQCKPDQALVLEFDDGMTLFHRQVHLHVVNPKRLKTRTTGLRLLVWLRQSSEQLSLFEV